MSDCGVGIPGLVATFATPGNLERLRHGCGENPVDFPKEL